MRDIITRFLRNEDGAVTVDWVVVTAAIVGLNLVVMFTPIREALLRVSGLISDDVDKYADYMEPQE